MKAFQWTRPRVLAEVEVPEPALTDGDDGKLLVRLRWGMVCGSDMPTFHGGKDFTSYPAPVGDYLHEAVGDVVSSRSTRFAPGDRVVAVPDGGAMSQVFLSRESKAFRLPPDLADDDASVLIQPLATVLFGLDRLGDVTGRSFAVIGLGPIGLMICWVLRRRGAGPIAAVDPCSDRCARALEFGASRAYPMRSRELAYVARFYPDEWQAPDVCVEAVGHQAETLNDCIALVRPAGTILNFGSPEHTVYPVDFHAFYSKNLTLSSSVGPSWERYLPVACSAYCEGAGVLRRLVTHRMPIQESVRAYTMYEKHEPGSLKVLLDATGW